MAFIEGYPHIGGGLYEGFHGIHFIHCFSSNFGGWGGGGRHAGFWVGRENSLLQFACESQFSLSEHLNRNLVKETVC